MTEGTALVLEGGGYRGIFTAGVLDVFMEHGLYGFNSVWGTSAGSLAATSFRSRQIGRTMRIMLAFRDDKRLISVFSLAKHGDITGGEFLYHDVQDTLDPCDLDVFNNNPTRMFCTVSDMVFGSARYLEVKHLPEDVEMIHASSAIPLVSHPIEIDGHRYLDGGTCDSMAVEPALGLIQPEEVEDFGGAERAVVVLTRERTYVKDSKIERMAVLSRRYAEYPLYVQALNNRAKNYMRTRDLIFELEKEGRVLVIEPPSAVSVTASEHVGAPLLDLYLKGRRAAEKRFAEIVAFLG